MAAINRRYQKNNDNKRQTAILLFSLDAVTWESSKPETCLWFATRTEYQVAERHRRHLALLQVPTGLETLAKGRAPSP